MNRSLIVVLIIIFLILVTAITLGAQGRSHSAGSRGFGGGFNVPPVVRPGPPVVARPPVAAAPFRGPVSGFRPIRPTRPVVVAPIVGGYYSPYYWPSPVYGYGSSVYPAYSSPGYYDQGYSYPDTVGPAANQNELDLAYQVGQLSAQVAQLQQQQQQGITTYTQPSSPLQRSAQPAATPTELVFRDGHGMDIQNYAIVGDTLWVLDAGVATKIPLSELDLDATQKENHSRGVRFNIPGQ